MPPKTRSPERDCDPIQATGPDSALAMIERLIAMGNVDHQSPALKAQLCRHMTDEFTGTVGYCFRELDIAPWGAHEADG